MRALLYGESASTTQLRGRTERCLAAAGVARIVGVSTAAALCSELQHAEEPVLLIRAGAWFVREEEFRIPAVSSTGRPLIALGAVRSLPDQDDAGGEMSRAWELLLKQCGGDLNRRPWFRRCWAEPVSCYLEPAAARALALAVERGCTLRHGLQTLTRARDFRAIHLPRLDVHYSVRLRVLQVVTTIQIGGAERVTVDLAEELIAQGMEACVATVGKPTRLSFPVPRYFADLSGVSSDPERRGEAVARLCREFGADLVHAHLVREPEARAIRAHGIPLLMTVHNMPQSWPPGLGGTVRETADLLVACSRAVEAAVCKELPEAVVRTAWNGIGTAVYSRERAPSGERERMRESLGFAPDDFVLIALANARSQKRLERLPEIVHHLQHRLVGSRAVRLVVAGAIDGITEDAHRAGEALRQAIAEWNVAGAIHQVGPLAHVAPFLRACDALVSVSEFEGLSLAHLEALACSLPVVATDAGGTREIAEQSDRMHLLPVSASAAEFCDALAAVAERSSETTSRFPKSFTRWMMTRRYQWLYQRTLERFSATERPRRRAGLWLITNNFSTGGAQTSARRLLLGLAERGIRVRAAVIQEQPEYPTPGRHALLAAGIPVIALRPPGEAEAENAVSELLAHIANDPPEAVVFWNLITSYKVLLADGLLDTPVYDVSPGEMYFDSLDAYFAQPRPGLPYRCSRAYGERLAGVVVKYAAEIGRVAASLGTEVHVIRNGVPLHTGRDPGPKPPGGLLIFGTAARLAPHKRITDLLSAFHLAQPRLPRFVLRIAGGPERGQEGHARELRKRARGLPVEWCGELADSREFLNGLDVFVMISEPAGCPNASLEAMAAGLPVVVTDVGGASEQVIDGETGRLVPARDAEALAEALVELAHRADLRTRYGKAGRQRAEALFSLDRMISEYSRVFGLAPTRDSGSGGACALVCSCSNNRSWKCGGEAREVPMNQ